MKGIVCREINRFETAEFPVPELSDGTAIVRIKRIGVCGTDYHAYKGNQPFFTYPRVLGHELAGVIEEVGTNAEGFKRGDQVGIVPYLHCGTCIACRNGKTNCCASLQVMGVHVDGGMRELVSVPITHLIPAEGLTLDQTAVLEPFSIGAHAVRRADLQRGDTALVIGAGPIGLGVTAFAKVRGARVIAMDVNEERLAFSRGWARADHTVHALQDAKMQIERLSGGEYPSVVFDATGNAKSMAEAFELVAHGGKLVYVGLVKADIAFHDPEFHKRELTLMGSRNATKEDFRRVIEAVRSGAVDVNRYITHRASFDRMIESFEDWLKPESRVIKAIVEI